MNVTRMWGEYKSFSAVLFDIFGFAIRDINASDGFILLKSIVKVVFR